MRRADAVAALLADPARRAAIGAAARRRAKAEFTLARMVAAYERVLWKVLDLPQAH